MAFTKEVAVKPVAIGDITIKLFDPDPTGTMVQTATVHVQVKMDDGSIRQRSVNLADVVNNATITQLQNLAASLRTKANAELIPTP